MVTRLDNSARMNARQVRGFTVVEMLIVVAIIIVLLSVLIVALSAAARTGQAASTSARMQSISRGLVQFKTDVGYYPPVLNNDRGLYNVPAHDPIVGGYDDEIQKYYSNTSLAEFMVGYDFSNHDGYGSTNLSSTERPPFGIRHPLDDGVWGATRGTGQGRLQERSPKTTGDVFGPYIEIDDSRLIASIDGTTDPTGRLNVFFPGEGGYNDADPKVIVDYWGRPIEYYRRPYPIGGIRQGFTLVDRDGNGTLDRVPTLSDIFVLRPFSVRAGEDITAVLPDRVNDTTTTSALNSAEFALFSSGADLSVNREVRFDDPTIPGVSTDSFNRDNIVELGP